MLHRDAPKTVTEARKGSRFKDLGLMALVSAVVSVICTGFVNYYLQDINRVESAKIERAYQFSLAADELLLTGGEYVDAMAKGQDVRDLRIKLRGEIARQLLAADELKRIVPETHHHRIADYQSALSNFGEKLASADTPEKMRSYVEGFDRVSNAKLRLNAALAESTGVRS